SLRAVAADDGDRADVLVREAAEVVHEAARRLLLPLPRPGAALQLQIDLVDHAQPRGADRMPEAFEPAVDLTRDFSVGVEEPVHHVARRAALRRDRQILHGDELGHREAIVRLDEIDLLAGILYARLVIGALGGDAGRGEIAAVPGIVLRLHPVRNRELQRL